MNISKVFHLGALALAAAVFSGAAMADSAETKGGLKIKTDDGRFEASLGGRMHFDANLFFSDDDSFGGGAVGSGATQDNSSIYLRRVYLTLKGKFYGYDFKIEPDFAPNTGSNATQIAFQDVTLATNLGPGKIIIGQFKPFRAMEDLTSSNDILMIERPFASASGGFFAGGINREFQQGVGYKWPVANGLLVAASAGSLRSNGGAPNNGWSTSTRVTYTPILNDNAVIHAGFSFSHEQPQTGAAFGAQASQYAGRRGPNLAFANTACGNTACTLGRNALNTLGFELATALGPFFMQSELMMQDVPVGAPGAAIDHKILAYYVQGAYALTGETKPYKVDDAVFGSFKPINSWGALELTARYDFAHDADAAKDIIGASCVVSAPVATNAGGGGTCSAHTATVGLNYYANPNVRFMLNYVNGHADVGNLTDNPSALVLRTQFAI